jgi:hypothetical protein
VGDPDTVANQHTPQAAALKGTWKLLMLKPTDHGSGWASSARVQERWALGVGNRWLQTLRQAFLTCGLPPPHVAMLTRSLATRLRATNLLGYASRRNIRETARPFRVVELPVMELIRRRDFGVLYRKDAYLSPAARRFIETLRKIANDLARSGTSSESGTIGLDSCAAPAGPQCTTAWNLGDEVAMGKHGGAHRAGVNAALLNISPQ